MLITQNARIAHHRITTEGEEPTIPSSLDFTDGSWLITDLNVGEICFNITDDRAWFRSDNGIVEFEVKNSVTIQTAGAVNANSEAIKFTIEEGEACTVRIQVIAMASDNSESVGGEAIAVFYNEAGTINQVGTTTKDIKSTNIASPAIEDFDIITDGTDLFVNVTGIGGVTLNWKATYSVTKI